MRADLQVMEQIDLYLQGKMSVAESAAFQSKMAADPELANMVTEQQLFAQSVTRKAILSEIQLVAAAGVGGGSWYTNPFVGVAGVTVVGGIIAAAVYFNSGNDEVSQPENAIIAEQARPENPESITETYISSDGDTIEYTVMDSDPTDPGHVVVIQPNPESGGIEEVYHVNDPTNEKEPLTDVSDATAVVHNDPADIDWSDKRIRNKKACFPKGSLAMKEYVDENGRYPGTAIKEQLQGNVRVTFYVNAEGQKTINEVDCFLLKDKDGAHITGAQRTLGSKNSKTAKLFEEAAARIVRLMPAWEPATNSQGSPIGSTVQLLVAFSLPGEIFVYEE